MTRKAHSTAVVREPYKGAGVPRETHTANSLRALCTAVAPAALCSPEELESAITKAGYFEASMQQQLLLAAQITLQFVPPSINAVKDVIRRLGDSEVERVRGVAPAVAYLRLRTDPKACLGLLRRAATFDGAWPQEQAQGFVHQLVIDHGLATIEPQIHPWLKDKDPLVRRLVIEALRPRGVMVAHITELRVDPRPLRPMLEAVLDDDSLYVRKATANCINDISRDHGDLVCEWSSAWLSESASDERRWIVTRGLRSLLKAGHPQALSLLDLGSADSLELKQVSGVPSSVGINELLPLQITLANRSASPINVRVQVRMAGPGRANKPRQKVYHLQSVVVPPRSFAIAEKRLHFAHSNAQPKLPGLYTLHFEANGKILAERSFRFLEQ